MKTVTGRALLIHAVLTHLLLILFAISKAAQFSYPVGARAGAVGNASCTLSDVWSAFTNQAGLGYVHHINVASNYENRFLLPELSIKSFALAIPLKGTTFALSGTSMGYHLYSENKYGLGLGKAFGDKIAAGVQMDYLQTQIGEGYGNKSTMTVELGLIAKPVRNLVIGMHVFNPVRSKLTNYNNERISTILKAGAAYSFSEKVLLLAEVSKDNIQAAQFKAGLEYHPVPQLFLRGGMGTNPVSLAFGIGFHLSQLKIDISSAYQQVLGYTPQASLVYCFSHE